MTVIDNNSPFFATSSLSLSSEDDDDEDDEDDDPEEQEEDEDEELDPDRDEDDDEEDDLDEELDEELEEPSESESDLDPLLASLRLRLLSFFCFRVAEFGVRGLVLAATIRLSPSPSLCTSSFISTPEGVGGLTGGISLSPLSCSSTDSGSSFSSLESSLGKVRGDAEVSPLG